MEQQSKARQLEVLISVDTLDLKIMFKKMFFKFMHPLFKSVTTLISTNKTGLLVGTKVQASATASLYAIPAALCASFLGWMVDNQIYMAIVLIAIVIDYLLGSIKHLFWSRDWCWKENLKELLTKIFLIITMGVLFESVLFLGEGSTFLELIGGTAGSVLRLTVLLYPVSSAIKSARVLSEGKFPPEGIYTWIESFSKRWGPKKDNN